MSSAGPAPTTSGLAIASGSGRWVLLATILGSALAGIDATVVNIALPAIGDDLGGGFAALQWTVSGYALTLASFILLGGTLGDRFGRRRVFVVGVVWFALASLACGVAPDIELLVAARVVQGVGAALLTPGSLSILQASFRPEDRARAIGAWSGLGGVATAVGPLLGGWLVDVATWRLVFLINLPLAALVVWLAARHVPETHDPSADDTPVDVAGGLLGAAALAGLTYALIDAGGTGTLVGAAVAVVAAAAFVVRERRATYPVLPFTVFREAQFSAVNAVTLLIYGGFGVLLFLLVVQLQVVAGFGPVAAGSAMLPVTVLMLLLSARSGELASRIGPRLQLTVGPVVCAAGLLLLSRIGPDASYVTDVLPGVAVLGLGLAALVAPLTATALAAAPPEHAGMASGVNNAVARTGGLLAVAAVPALAGIPHGGYGGAGGVTAFADGYRHAVWIGAAIVLVGALVSAIAIRNDVLHDDGPPDDAATDLDAPARPDQLRHCGVGAPPLACTGGDPAGRGPERAAP